MKRKGKGIGAGRSYQKEDHRRWRGTPEKVVAAPELAPYRCSVQFASWSLLHEEGKGEYSTYERGAWPSPPGRPSSTVAIAAAASAIVVGEDGLGLWDERNGVEQAHPQVAEPLVAD